MLTAHQLLRGQVGEIKAHTGPGVYDVAFTDASGTVYARVTLPARQMLLLHWQPTEAQRSA